MFSDGLWFLVLLGGEFRVEGRRRRLGRVLDTKSSTMLMVLRRYLWECLQEPCHAIDPVVSQVAHTCRLPCRALYLTKQGLARSFEPETGIRGSNDFGADDVAVSHGRRRIERRVKIVVSVNS